MYSMDLFTTLLHLGNHFYYWGASTALEGTNEASKHFMKLLKQSSFTLLLESMRVHMRPCISSEEAFCYFAKHHLLYKKAFRLVAKLCC